jgi:threonine dehydrogenase-like Zn-dependent dehydrogenase
MMHAIQFDGKGLIPIERPLWKPGPCEVLLKVQACGICGTDIKILNGESEACPPVILGHEFCGIVEETGKQVSFVKPGDYISVDPNIVCGQCRFCRKGKVNLCEKLTALGVNIDGGFATHCYVPERQCHPLPPFLPPEQAVLMEPLSCALYGFQKAQIQSGDAVAIVGGGIIGMIMLKLIQLSAARTIILLEPDENRRNVCTSLGADAVFDPKDLQLLSKIQDLTQGGADSVIECVGSIPALETAFSLLNRGGRLVIFGVTPPEHRFLISPHDFFKNDITVTGSFLNPHTFQTAIDLIKTKRLTLNDVEIKTFPLTDIQNAIENQKQRKSLKTVITMNT